MISQFKDKHKDKTCLIVGNGPSLKNVGNNWLSKYPTFGSNRIFLKYIPDYYVAVNNLVIEQNRNNIQKIDCEKFIPQGFGIISNELTITREHKFCLDPSKEVYEGYTVTFVSLQLAYYMGFTTVLLIGVDHRYKYDGKPNEVHLMKSDDPNHFDDSYFKNQLWNNPDLVKSEEAYSMAKYAYEYDGRKIINITPNSALNIFEKGDMSEW
jgi:hypothetical protein